MRQLRNTFNFLIALSLCGSLYAQTTAIPDANFEQFLVDQGIDSNGVNGNILNADAQAVTALNVSVNTVLDFTGLEAFVNLVTFNGGRNQFITLPLNSLVQLEELVFTDNDALASLDLSANGALKILDIESDFSGASPHPPITSLDLSANTALEDVNLFLFVNMASLIFPDTPTLEKVELYNLGVQDINLQELAGLENFRMRFSSATFTTINLPDEKEVLRILDVQGISIGTIDISEYTVLERVEFDGLDLTTMLLPTTNTLVSLGVRDHDLGFLDLSIVPNLVDLDITGILNTGASFSVDVTQNPDLENIDLSRNKMSVLNITQNIILEELTISSNLFTSLDVTQNVNLEELTAPRNLLDETGIDLTQNVVLERLNLSDNQFTDLDITQNVALGSLIISNNLFTGTGLNLNENIDLYYLDCSYNQIESLDISSNISISGLIASHNLFPGTSIVDQLYTLLSNNVGINASNNFYFDHNLLSGRMPDFASLVSTNTNFYRFKFNDNNFHFGDFEDEHSEYVLFTNSTNTFGSSELPIMTIYDYAPQAKVDEIEAINENAGNDITLTCEVRGAQNHYKWFKDGVEIPDSPDSPELILTDLNSCDEGVYHTEITSDLVPFENTSPPGTSGKNLLLIRNDITLGVAWTPECSSLTMPVDGDVNVPITTGLTWSNSKGACGYRIDVGTASGGTDLVNNEDVGDVQTYNFATNLPVNTQIFVTVTPYYSDGSESTCAEESFITSTTTTLAACTSIFSPADGATNVATTTDIFWNPSNGADGYLLNVGTTSGGVEILDEENVGSATSYDFATDLPEGTTIYVTVIPYNVVGNTLACAEISFTTQSVLSIPACTTLTVPTNGATDVTVDTDLSWNTSATAEGYLLTVATTSGGTEILDNEDVGNVTTYNLLADLPEDTQIFVSIIPYNTAGNASSCTEESFTTEIVLTPPSCTTLIVPTNGAMDVTVDTDLSWNANTTAEGYFLTVGTTSGGSEILNNLDLGNVTTYDLPADLPEETQIFVTLIPYNSAGNASSCTEESFTTELLFPDCTSLTNPLNGAVDVAIDTDLSWNASPTSDGYFLTVGTTSGGTEIINNQDIGNVTTFDLPNDLPEFTQIFVSIVPYNDTGNATDCAEESFTTQLFVPDCVTLTTPTNGAVNVSLGTDLSWTTATTADGYFVTVGTTSGGADIVNNQDVENVTTFDLPNDLPELTEIFVSITPYNATGNAVGCTEKSFTTELLLPDCTSLTDPLDGAVDVLVGTDLSWDSSPTADGYFLSVGTTSGGTDILNNQDVGNVTTFDLPNDLPELTEIFVSIVPYNDTGNATGCTEESFTTQLFVPDCVMLTNPVNGETDVLLGTDLSWTTASTADGYILSVGTTSGGTDIISNQDVGNVTTFDLPDDLPEFTEIFVTITPYNATGNGAGCAEESFITELLLPDCTSLTNPLDGDMDVTIGTDLSWNISPTANGYFLTVGTTSGGTDILNNQDVGNVTTFDLPTDLPEFTEIFVSIVPYNDTGNATGCTEESFTTQLFVPDCVMLTNPVNGETDVLLGTDLSWTTASTADGYFLTVGTTSGGTDIISNQDVGNVTTFDLPNDLPEFTQIFISITPYNATGNGVGCAEESLITELLLPDCTSLTDPLNGAVDVLVGTDLSWNISPTADGCFLTVGTTSGGTDILNNQDVGNVTTFDLPTDLPEFTEIFVSIVPYNDTGNATGCTEESFTTQLFVPDCVMLTNPVNGETDVLLGTDLSWTTATTADGYLLSVGTTSGEMDIVSNQDVGNVTTFDLPNDLPEFTEIFVSITPYNATGNATGCMEESFTTELLLPDCTSLTSPLNGAIDVLVGTDLSWNASPTADGYFLTVGTTSGGTDILNNQDVGNVITFDLPNDLPERTEIFVTVIPYNARGNTSGCTEESFITELLVPECVSLTNPLNNAEDVAVGTDLSWSTSPTADGYILSVGTTPSGTEIIDSQDVGDVTTFDLTEDLPEFTRIFVSIIPYNTTGNGTGCNPESFVTQTVLTPPECTTLIDPLDGASNVSINVDFRWNPSATASGYLLSVGTSPDGFDILDGLNMGNVTTYDLASSLPQETQIFVTVVPYNDAGIATDCFVTEFTTRGRLYNPRNDQKFGFSPDGDGINEFWEIKGITDYPNNTVYIYNRWGEMVFEIQGYDNRSNVFRGSANKATGRGAGELPEGTYFFQIDIPEEHDIKKQGYLILKR